MTPRGRTARAGGIRFKTWRIAFLLLVLLLVALKTWQDRYRSTQWRQPLFVAIYPIAGDSSSVTARYVADLSAAQFQPIDRFFGREAARHGLHISEPVRTRLQPPLTTAPPLRAADAGIVATILWSLRLRYWAWSGTPRAREPQDIRLFVLYHDPALTSTVPHSLGLTKGLIGVVYAFAAPTMDDENDVVMAHELLHTVGATDKYVVATDAPRFPEGYGDPQQLPLYPQRAAELMAGRRMLSATRWEQAADLNQVVIGAATAAEIRWSPNAP